ncbi:hypothetical protein [Aeromonas aquatica]|uniref:hypothetical protein n=1 Tax=Aeromonas aquatica TaxID=558964 RepID=UPI00126A025A|nr:hypothetical protein [Aeromonas aquatica]
MYLETAASILASLGGASVIIAGFAHFLGKIWTDRIAEQTTAKYSQELEILKSKHNFSIENFKKRAESEMKDREQFSGISIEVYQNFFKSRIQTYSELLKIKNEYFTGMNEDFLIELTEEWGHVYITTYNKLKTIIMNDQLYISNDLELKFIKLRSDVAEYIKEADLAKGNSMGAGMSEAEANEEISPILDRLAKNTHHLMNEAMQQIESDVRKLRSRIEIDRL